MAHSPLTRIARDRQATLDQAERARLALERHLRSLAEQLAGRRLQLAALSPRATLDRGYSIVTTTGGEVVRSAGSVAVGDGLAIELADGTVDATTTGVRTPPPNGTASSSAQTAAASEAAMSDERQETRERCRRRPRLRGGVRQPPGGDRPARAGRAALEAAIVTFERGMALANRCDEILEAAELRVTRVLEASAPTSTSRPSRPRDADPMANCSPTMR